MRNSRLNVDHAIMNFLEESGIEATLYGVSLVLDGECDSYISIDYDKITIDFTDNIVRLCDGSIINYEIKYFDIADPDFFSSLLNSINWLQHEQAKR